MAKFGEPIGFRDYFEQDGSYMLLVKTPFWRSCRNCLQPSNGASLCSTFHTAIMSHWPQNTPNPEFPILVLKGLVAGHGFLTQPEVMATTDRIANVILSASDAVLEQAQNAISQVLELRAAKGKGLH